MNGDSGQLDVFQDRRMGSHARDLKGPGEPHAAKLMRRQAGYVLPVEINVSGLGPQVAGKQVEERGFPGPVRSDDRANLPARHRDTDVPGRMNAAKAPV